MMKSGLITLMTVKATDPATGKFDAEKFAELIVKECADLIDDDWANVLKQHFGVE